MKDQREGRGIGFQRESINDEEDVESSENNLNKISKDSRIIKKEKFEINRVQKLKKDRYDMSSSDDERPPISRQN